MDDFGEVERVLNLMIAAISPLFSTSEMSLFQAIHQTSVVHTISKRQKTKHKQINITTKLKNKSDDWSANFSFSLDSFKIYVINSF